MLACTRRLAAYFELKRPLPCGQSAAWVNGRVNRGPQRYRSRPYCITLGASSPRRQNQRLPAQLLDAVLGAGRPQGLVSTVLGLRRRGSEEATS